MVLDYINYFLTFMGDALQQMNTWMVVDGVSFVSFIGALSIILVIVGMILLR